MTTRVRSALSRRSFVGGLIAAPVVAAPLSHPQATAQSTTELRLARTAINDQWHDTFNNVLDAFEQANPSISTTVEYRPGDQYWDKLQIEFASGTAPDLSIMNSNWVVPFASRGMLEDLNPYLTNDTFDVNALWYPLDREWGWNGGLYGGLQYAGGQFLYVNTDILDAAGVPFPTEDWTWNDFREAAQQLTDSSTNQWGVHFAPLNPPYWSAAFIHGAGGSVLNETYDKCTLAEPAARAGLQFIHDLIHVDNVMPTPSATEGQDNPFLTGKVAFYFGGNWDEAAIRTAGFNWDFAHMPVHPETGLRSVQMGSNAWSVLTTSQHKDAAWEVVKYLMSEEGQRGLMTLGIPVQTSVVEGEDFRAIHAPQNIDVVVSDLRNHGHDYYVTPDSSEWWDAVGQEFGPMWAGEESVETATDRASQAVDEIFARRPDEWK